MKTTRNALFALLLLAAGAVTAASAQVSVGAGIHIGPSGRAAVDLGFFYDNLAPYGNWIQRPNYGWVWAPTAVSTTWRRASRPTSCRRSRSAPSGAGPATTPAIGAKGTGTSTRACPSTASSG